MDLRLTGINPLSYEGVNATQPPQLILSSGSNARNPTVNDWQGLSLGTLWLNAATENFYVLVALGVNPMTNARQATWDLLASGASGAVTELTADVGAAFPVAGIIKIAGGANINTSAAGNIVTVNLNTSISQPNTNGSGSQGLYSLGGNNFLHNFGDPSNTFLGKIAGNLANLATSATGIGQGALGSISSGTNCTAVGSASMFNSTATSSCTAIGSSSLLFLASGSNVIAVGSNAGSSYLTTESSNIVIGNTGTLGESNTIRLGTQGGGAAQQNKCFVAGITGVTVPNPSSMVVVDNTTGQLGSGGGSIITNWVEVTGTSQAMSVGTGYVANNAGLVTLTLPSTAAFGSIIRVCGKGTGLFTVAQNAGQVIHFGMTDTTVGATGSITSNNRYDTVELLCTTTNTNWTVLSTVGNFTIA